MHGRVDKWLVTGGIAAVVLLLVNVVLAFVNTGRLRDDATRLTRSHDVIAGLDRLSLTAAEAVASVRAYLLTGDRRDLAPFERLRDTVEPEIAALEELARETPSQVARVAGLRSRAGAELERLARLVETRDREGSDAASRGVAAGRGSPDVALRGPLAELRAEEDRQLRERSADAARSSRLAFASELVSGASALAALAAFLLLLRRNLSARSRAAETIAGQAERFRVTLSSIGDAVITTDLEGLITDLNPVAESLTGWSSATAVGQPLEVVFRIVNESTGEPVENPARRVLREGVVVGLANHTLLIARDGSQRPIDDSAAPIRSREGATFGCVLVFRDVADRREREARLAQSEARFRRLLMQVATPTVLHTDTGEVLLVNDIWTSLTGYTQQDIPSIADWTRKAYGERHQAVKEYIDTLFAADAKVDDGEWRVRTSSGEERTWHFYSTPMGTDSEGRRLVLSTAIDLTEQKKVEAELRRLAAELSETDRRKDEFLATLAHELRNPLAPLRNGLQILRRSPGDGDASHDARTMMERQLELLVRLVDDLLDVSRISRGMVELRKVEVALADVIGQAVETSRPAMEAAGHRLTVSVPATPMTVDADPARLAQVFSNLLNNAAKFTPPYGRLWLAAERQDGRVLVRVRDNGIGIAPDLLPRVFDLFTQGDHTLEKTRGGLGIGLTLVKRLVDLHGGTVHADSPGVGQGSEFTVSLPLCAKETAEHAFASPQASRGSVGRHRVLVADDNRDSAESLALALKLDGHEVRIAADGLQAVEIAAAFRPAMILMDIGMPVLNGYEAARRIRTEAGSRPLLLIAITGWGQSEDQQRSRAAGFDHHLVKPVDFDVLNGLMTEWAGAGFEQARATVGAGPDPGGVKP